MSHMIRARASIKDKTYLIDALKDLGWQFTQSGSSIKLGNSMELIQNRDQTWTVTGDPWYDQTGLRKYYNKTHELIADLQAHYNKNMVQDKVAQMGYFLAGERENKDEIVLIFENGM